MAASNSKGQIFDRQKNKFIESHPYPGLLFDCFRLSIGDKRISELLAIAEEDKSTIIIFDKMTIETLIFKFAINPEVIVMFKKRKIDKETGEVIDESFVSDMEQAINLHVRFTKEVIWLVNEKSRAVADCDNHEDLGVLSESLKEAKSRLLGNNPDFKNWRDFTNYKF